MATHKSEHEPNEALLNAAAHQRFINCFLVGRVNAFNIAMRMSQVETQGSATQNVGKKLSLIEI